MADGDQEKTADASAGGGNDHQEHDGNLPPMKAWSDSLE